MIIPRNNDVLFGRGAGIMGHPGNRRLRSMVERQRKAFVEAAKRKEKRSIATDIIQEIQNLQPAGRFLTEDPQGKVGRDSHNDGHASIVSGGIHTSIMNKSWICVEPDKALTKVMHGLREKGTGCGSGGGRQIEMQKQQTQPTLTEQEKAVQHPPENNSVKAGFSTAQLPQLLIDNSTVTNANITDSTAMPLGGLGIFSNRYIQPPPPDQLDLTAHVGQIPPENHHMYYGPEVLNRKVDLDGVLSLLNFAMQNQRAELTGNADHSYAEARHFRHP